MKILSILTEVKSIINLIMKEKFKFLFVYTDNTESVDFIEDKVFVVSSVLERCDYIRFSGGKEEDSSFSFVERSSLSENLIEAFTVIANQRSL